MFRWLGLSLAVLLSACSLVVDSSIDRLRCDRETPCDTAQGYSCAFDTCVKKGSLKEGNPCQLSEQCGAGLVCPALIAVCSKPCDKIFALDSGCPSDSYCGPVYDEDPANRGKFSGGACIKTECEEATKCQREGGKFVTKPTNATSGSNLTCVRVAQKGGVCMRQCNVGPRAVNNQTTGADPCLADKAGNPQHCGVLGVDDKPTLVCLPAGAAREGDACSLFPVSGRDPEACGLNVVDNNAGLPLVCMNAQGTATGTNLKCRISQCTGSGTECANGGICSGEASTTPPFRFCKLPTE